MNRKFLFLLYSVTFEVSRNAQNINRSSVWTNRELSHNLLSLNTPPNCTWTAVIFEVAIVVEIVVGVTNISIIWTFSWTVDMCWLALKRFSFTNSNSLPWWTIKIRRIPVSSWSLRIKIEWLFCRNGKKNSLNNLKRMKNILLYNFYFHHKFSLLKKKQDFLSLLFYYNN